MKAFGAVRVPAPPDIDPIIAVVQSPLGGARTVLMGPSISGKNSLICVGVLLICLLGLGSFTASNSREEATAVLERLTAKAELAQRISPETRRVLAELLAKLHYDCDRLRCGARLHERNRLARARLKEVIGGSHPSAMKASGVTAD
jgi:hypothetical protein